MVKAKHNFKSLSKDDLVKVNGGIAVYVVTFLMGIADPIGLYAYYKYRTS